MCDYSLMTIPNRLAENGEDLVVYRFSTGSRGFTSLSDRRKMEDSQREQSRQGFWSRLKRNLFDSPKTSSLPAVCIPPGARLKLQDIPVRLQQDLQVDPVEEVIFTELTAVTGNYRDAIIFPNGRHVLLQRLDEGQRAKVLDLSSAEAVQPYEEWSDSRLYGRR
ncbi:MAG: hypothetical protein ACRD3O_21020 [Terriglobia bacterium]